MKKYTQFVLLVILVLLLLAPMAVYAQEDGGSLGDLEGQLSDFLAMFLEGVVDLTLLPFAVPLVVILVALVKRIPLPFIQNISAGAMHLTVQVIIWAAYAVFVKFGRGDVFEQWTNALVIVLQTLLPLVASLFGATWLYDKAKASAIPLLGYQRSDPTALPALVRRG